MPEASRPFRLLVFDWDGTIMDSIGAIVDCTFAALDALDSADGVAASPAAPVTRPDRLRVRHSIGMGLAETMRAFFPGADPELHRRVLEAYSRQWVECYKDRFTPFAGARETLVALRGAGYLLGVATAKSRRGLTRDFERSGLGPLFDASRTVDEAPSKPHPGMLEGLFAELGVHPGEALMIGDTNWDLEMAAAAGCAAVGVLSGAQPEELLARSQPLACLPDLTAIPAFLESLAARPTAAAG
jgi:phosphoglycolate phosphatase